MQQTGTLKKRKKRNIAKVNGLSTIQYNELEDTFTGRTLFSDITSDYEKPFVIRNAADTRLRMTSSYLHRRGSNSEGMSSAYERRATRNPRFHLPPEDSIDYSDRGSTAVPNFSSRDYIKERSHFLDVSTMNRLKMLLLLAQASGALPYRWNSKTYRIDKWSPWFEKAWKFQWFFVTIQTTILTGFQIYSFYHEITDEHKTFREMFMNSFSVYWYLCAVFFNINMFLHKDEIRQYINTMLRFNNEYVVKYLLHLDGYQDGGRILINLSIPSNCSQVFASVTLFLVMPYQSWYLFSYIYPKPWYWLIPGAIQEFVVVGQVITSYMLISWIVVAHTNSVEFWLRETHNHNDSDFTRDDLRHPKLAIETYRGLQILCTIFNNCMSPLAIPLVKIHIMTGLVPCAFVVVRSMNHLFIDEFPGILTYPISVIDCASAGFAFMALAAEVFDLAAGFVDSWSRTRHKDFRRVLMSCPTLKVKVARFYFITISTTITFFKVAFDFVTDLIITFPT